MMFTIYIPVRVFFCERCQTVRFAAITNFVFSFLTNINCGTTVAFNFCAVSHTVLTRLLIFNFDYIIDFNFDFIFEFSYDE